MSAISSLEQVALQFCCGIILIGTLCCAAASLPNALGTHGLRNVTHQRVAENCRDEGRRRGG
jgi:hypothetical protein